MREAKKDGRSSPCVRFSLTGHYSGGFYVACSLEEGWLRYWETWRPFGGYEALSFGTRDERAVFDAIAEKGSEGEDCKGWELEPSEIEELISILDEDALQELRGGRHGEACERMAAGGYRMTFYAEMNDGSPPVIVEGETACFIGEGDALDRVCVWLMRFGIMDGHDYWGSIRWDKKRSASDERDLVQRALGSGIDAIHNLLYDGKASQIRLIEELDHETPLSYACNYPDSFVLRVGRSISRAYGMSELPNCVRVFGDEHEF